jgi:hypothetical protein
VRNDLFIPKSRPVKFLWRGITRLAGKLFYSKYSFVFINGFLLASLFYFYTEDSYEKKLFETLALYVKENTSDAANREEALLLKSLHLTHFLGKNRADIFSIKQVSSFKASVIHPVTYDLMTASGACGSYSYILSRLLNELKIPNRIAQMKVDSLYGGHILVEAKTSRGWVVLDGSYDLYFKKANGALAGFEDVKNNWDYYHTQIPSGYNPNYRYEGVRYMNWDKIPVVMPALKGILTLAIGKKAVNDFSLRSSFLRKFHLLFLVTAFLFMMLWVIVICKYIRKGAGNLKRYLLVLFSDKRSLFVLVREPERKRA